MIPQYSALNTLMNKRFFPLPLAAVWVVPRAVGQRPSRSGGGFWETREDEVEVECACDGDGGWGSGRQTAECSKCLTGGSSNQREMPIATQKALQPKSLLPTPFCQNYSLIRRVCLRGGSYQSDFNPGLFQYAQVGFGGTAVGDDLLHGGRRDD
jgi:hypothetical protein